VVHPLHILQNMWEKIWEYTLFLNSNVNTKYFCGVGFSSSMAIGEAMLDVSKDHGSWSIKGGNQVRISKLIDMFLIIALMIRTNVQALIYKVLTRG